MNFYTFINVLLYIETKINEFLNFNIDLKEQDFQI